MTDEQLEKLIEHKDGSFIVGLGWALAILALLAFGSWGLWQAVQWLHKVIAF